MSYQKSLHGKGDTSNTLYITTNNNNKNDVCVKNIDVFNIITYCKITKIKNIISKNNLCFEYHHNHNMLFVLLISNNKTSEQGHIQLLINTTKENQYDFLCSINKDICYDNTFKNRNRFYHFHLIYVNKLDKYVNLLFHRPF